MPLLPKVPQKYRITVDCLGFKPESIKTKIEHHKLFVTGREDEVGGKEKDDKENFSFREFRKSFELPKGAETDKLVSFMTKNGELIIEMPVKESKSFPNSDLFPRIIDNPDGTKSVAMKFALPHDVDINKCNVMVKDRDLIFRCEEEVDRPDKTSKFYMYKVSCNVWSIIYI
jgi:hypothetical protein